MKLHILTITYNGVDYIKSLAPSLFNCILPESVVWHIRDNDSKDDTENIVKNLSSPFPIFYHKIDHNKDNYAACHNYLINKAEADLDNDWYLFLNNDIVINDKKSIKKMLKLIKDDVGVVGTKLLYPNNTVQHGGIIFKKEYGGLPYHYKVGHQNNQYVSKNRQFQAVTFAFALVKASCVSKLKNGKLDEGYSWCFEDVSVCLDVLYRQKMKILYCGDTNITHLESATLKKTSINKPYQNHNFNKFRQEWKDIVKYDG